VIKRTRANAFWQQSTVRASQQKAREITLLQIELVRFQHFTHLAHKNLGGEGLGKESQSRLQNAVADDCLVRVTGYE